jgi:hypothetical protein
MYKKGSANYVVEFLSHPMIVALTMVLNSYGHGTIGWPQLYNSKFDYASTYKTLSTRKQVLDFHSRMHSFDILSIFFFLQVSMQIKFWRHIIFGWQGTSRWII